MCRLAAYLGPPILLRQFLLEPEHNLIRQSWAPQEMDGAVLNADGFGLGWYTDDNVPATYLNTQPAWSDVNLDSLAATISRPLWLGYVRSATPGQMTGLANTQPFVDGRILYTHNGYIENFSPAFRIRYHEVLLPATLAAINGNTDSEYLFAILRQHCNARAEVDLESALLSALAQMAELVDSGSALLNFIITDGQTICAVRHAINADCPSLYYNSAAAAFPDAILLASERLTADANWQAVPAHHLLRLGQTGKTELTAL